MPNSALAAVARALDPDPPGDADLVTRFIETRDEAAFAELLHRHGPMVLGVCRRILADPHDAEDAFQAAFVVLARRAGAVRPPGRVGPFLYGVAVKTATKAKIMAAKRRQREQAVVNPGVYTPGSPDWSDLRPVIDEELARLSDDLRAAVVLCDLGGKSRSEAARELGWPEGTLATRLAKARDLLAARLTRRGVTLSAALLAPVATVSPVLASATLAAALGGSATAVPPSVQLLAEGVVRSMYASYWKLGAAAVVALGGLVAGGLAVMASGGPTDPAPPKANGAAPARPAVPPPAVERIEDLWAWQPRKLEPWQADHGGPIRSIQFAPDGKTFTTVGRITLPAGVVKVDEAVAVGGGYRWDLSDLRRRVTYSTAQPDPVAGALSPDGATVALAAANRVWLMGPAKPEGIVLNDLGGSALAFSPDGKRLAVTDGLQTRVVGFPPGGGEVSFGPLNGAVKDGAAAAVAWAPDGKRIVFLPNTRIDPTWPGNGANSPDPAKATHWYAQVWGAGSGEAMVLIKQGTARLTALAWSADGSTIATADADGGIVLWDGTTFAEKKRLTAPGGVTALAIRADGKRIAVGVTGAKPTDPATAPQVVVYTEWEPAKNWQESSSMGGPAGETVRSVAFSPDGKVLAAAADGGLRLWDRVFVKAADAR